MAQYLLALGLPHRHKSVDYATMFYLKKTKQFISVLENSVLDSTRYLGKLVFFFTFPKKW